MGYKEFFIICSGNKLITFDTEKIVWYRKF